MMYTSTLSTDDEDVSKDPNAVLEELRSVMSDVDQFLVSWFDQVRHDIAMQARPVTADAALKKQIEAFRQERSQWEAKRTREQKEIEAKVEQLSAAWLRLEDEQRRFLQMQEGARHTTRETCSPDEPVETAVSATPSISRTESPLGGDKRTKPVGASRENVVQQFQQLRAEIESSRINRAV